MSTTGTGTGAGEDTEPGIGAADIAEPGAVTVVVPTFNESANVRELLHRLTESVPGRLPCEVVFVDDSTDTTPEVIRSAAQDCPFPVTVIHRESPDGGLGGAVVEGLRAAGSEWIVVMDADLQHPPALVPELIAAGEAAGADLVVASRYLRGGSREGLAGGYRIAVSRTATWLTKALFPRGLRGISDPMSGFFAIRRSAVTDAVAAGELRPLGYKILLELAVRLRPRAVAEVPFVFRERFAGESKSTPAEGLRFLRHLVGLRTAAPLARMIAFGLIGLTGFVPNLLALYLLTQGGMHYLPAEVAANQFGVAWNFLLIEVLLFRDRRGHRHWADRMGRFALLANADLLLRIPLIALLVAGAGMPVLPATALALLLTFVLRFAATEALVYLPRGPRGSHGSGRPGASRPGSADHV
ncbi:MULTISPECIES: glycosyltransferase [Streptomyces]|uniref:Glycosyltransferase family 2 protein n=1 Tax=Streptomyces tsukubensis (strain DSM 42081 / NBRC 108919 / NRRL 18488 / 9993) TaxID=1114943 RepID=I2N547_STRT9|nr:MULTISPECIES: glycosyltransferase [Streptomyces]AZK96159.1 dolichol-phosphate mannosyltransferase [Streptomyces tsukubensis]EIF92144.1 dolichol-phosphate mannosyltransferase [Streptomyces tsukubensis NRRL18488]MYS68624.1 glycosyltransferase [Streptomyces sp. SID5473]QKM67825.1 glycosyltransferase family 2 protein [Streptomyces tsukubensis NRRL18488]TAI44221.1 glycosyltransferase family 2 protein [Streptomyces tsukubensis]